MKLKYAKLHQPVFIPNTDGAGNGVNLRETLEIGSKIKAMIFKDATVFVTVGKVTAGIPATNFSVYVADEADEA